MSFKFKYNGFYFVRENPSVQICTDVSNVKKEEISLPSSEPVFGSEDKDDPGHVYDVFRDQDFLANEELDPIEKMQRKELDDIIATGSKVAADNINPTHPAAGGQQ